MENVDLGYVLGHSQAELKRLDLQGQYWGEATLELLRRAGISPGMRVVDIGCGSGDVSCLAARLVGATGYVLGIDRSAEAVEAARMRARSRERLAVEFAVQDLTQWEPAESFDALVGRFILMYLPDPAGMLRRLVSCVRPGGVVAFLEMSMDRADTVPSAPEVEQVFDWIRKTFRCAGVSTDCGPRLWSMFRAAGLPEPELLLRGRIEAPPAKASTVLISETVRSLLPLMERFGVVRPGQVEVADLPSRLQAALVAHDAAVITPVLFAAWARVGQ
jgi:ubiquinone/menaquinone biosynthesis C-methylase UbiE